MPDRDRLLPIPLSASVTPRMGSVALTLWLLLLGLPWTPSLGLSPSASAAPPFWTEQDPATPTLPALQQLDEALIDLTRQLLPSVVSLRVHTSEATTELPKDHPPLPENSPPFGTGSGFIIRADGLMLTNYHVVENSTNIDVLLFTGEITTAKVLGQDPVGDLAVLQIAADGALPVAPLGSSTDLKVGEFVIAIGSPFGFEHTITFGIVSGTKRQLMRSGVVGGFIQTDASINTGNSGGPLVNMRGEVIGVNTATVGRGELGFAIPIDAVKAVLPQLYEGGAPSRGWLGIQIRPVDPEKAQALGLDPPRGVYVHDVLNDQPAQQAGIQVGDIILQFDHQTVATPFDLQSVVAATPTGKRVEVQVYRKQALHTVNLTVGTMPTQQ